jgi:hypothetical protein
MYPQDSGLVPTKEILKIIASDHSHSQRTARLQDGSDLPARLGPAKEILKITASDHSHAQQTVSLQDDSDLPVMFAEFRGPGSWRVLIKNQEGHLQVAPNCKMGVCLLCSS